MVEYEYDKPEETEWEWEAQTVFLIYLLMFCFLGGKLSDKLPSLSKYIPAEMYRFSVQSVLDKLQTETTLDFLTQTEYDRCFSGKNITDWTQQWLHFYSIKNNLYIFSACFSVVCWGVHLPLNFPPSGCPTVFPLVLSWLLTGRCNRCVSNVATRKTTCHPNPPLSFKQK